MNRPPKVPRPARAPRVPVPDHLRAPGALRAGSGPVVERGGDACVVTFVHEAPAAREVLLFANRLTDETDLDASRMERLGVGLWALSLRMAPDWRASYCFVPHVGDGPAPWEAAEGHAAIRALLDRGVPDTTDDRVVNRTGTALSVVSLPDAPPQPWRGTPHAGRPPRHEVAGRSVWVHRVGEGEELPVVVVLDGEAWLDHHGLAEALDAAHTDGALPAHLAVFVASGSIADRWQDVGHAGGVTAFVATELLPWVHERFDVTCDPARTVVAGQSLGGLSALWAAARFPSRVGVAVAQSASLWSNDPGDELAASGGRVLLEVGLQEWTLLPLHRDLAARVPQVELLEFNGGHDYACWRGGLLDALVRAL